MGWRGLQVQMQRLVAMLLDGGVRWQTRFSWTGYRKPMNNFLVKERGFKPTWIVIHHSLTPDGTPKDWDAIRRYHIEHNGWRDIGYNLGLEKVGDRYEVLQGRAIGEVGAHAVGFNAKSIGICLVGNFDLTPPPDDMLFLASSVCRELQRRFKIHRDQVIGHRETYTLLGEAPQKSCPGKQFDMAAFRSRLLEIHEV